MEEALITRLYQILIALRLTQNPHLNGCGSGLQKQETSIHTMPTVKQLWPWAAEARTW